MTLSLKYGVVLKYSPAVAAADILAQAKVSQPPVRFDHLLPNLGPITLVPADLEKDGYLLQFPDGSGEILYARSTVSSKRWRFTVAHELGHWITKRYADSGNLTAFRQASFEEAESWCDEFAKHLLMPERWISHLLTGSNGVAGALNEGPAIFEVSRQAFESRLVESFAILPVWLDKKGIMRVPPIVGAHRRSIEEQLKTAGAAASPFSARVRVRDRVYSAYLMEEDAP